MSTSSKDVRLEFCNPDYPKEKIYVLKKAFEGLQKLATITNFRIISGKLVIEYEAKAGSTHGIMELFDIGKYPEKKKEGPDWKAIRKAYDKIKSGKLQSIRVENTLVFMQGNSILIDIKN